MGGPVRSYIARSGIFRLGSFDLSGLIVRLSLNRTEFTATQLYAGLIGPDVFKQFVLTFDYARKRLIFEKSALYGRRDTYDRAGVWLSQVEGAFEVFDVIHGGPADLAGLRVGDLLLAIDGKSTAKLRLPKVRDSWKYHNPGTVIRLSVQKASGQKESTKLVLEDLV